jgi:uncharacterized repeat protein (TIGR01451 family)
MRLLRRHRHIMASLGCLLPFLLSLLPWLGEPAPAAAQISQGGSFGSAAACLQAEDSFATSSFTDTIFDPAPWTDAALLQVGMTTKSPLATVGVRGGGTNARVMSGIGSVYGLAYDDGAASGVRRLFAAAYTKRLASFGLGGPGGVYAYDFSTRTWSLAFSVPGAGWERMRGDDTYDSDAIAQVGLSGLGDMEISPDGRELFIVNIGARRIERYNLTANPPSRGAPIVFDAGPGGNDDPLDLVAGTNSAAIRADFIPFALEFSPFVLPEGPALVLGFTDTARRAVIARGTDEPLFYPAAYVATYFVNSAASQKWQLSLRQDLHDTRIRNRMRDSQIAGLWAGPPYYARGVSGWNPWHNELGNMPRSFIAGLGNAIQYPQPLLTDIEFTHDGRQMFLGLRDRTGDQVFAAEAPAGQYSAIAQGDTLAYSLIGASWSLQTTSRTTDVANTNPDDAFVRPAQSDYFDDNRHAFDPTISPLHVENNHGALATALQGDGGAPTERLATTALHGNRQSGLSFYHQGGGHWAAANNGLITASPRAGGKAANLGDLELLCTYAFVNGRVWDDLDTDGVQDPGEPGMANVRLEAFRGSPTNPADATAVTDAQGRYRFALPPNSPYNIRIAAADRAIGGRVAGYRFTPHNRGGDDTRDSDASLIYGYVEFAGSRAAPTTGATGAAITMPVREQELNNIDIGLTQLQGFGTIGDRVWEDRNSNGLQDAGEPGLADPLLSTMSLTLVPDPQTAIIFPSLPAVTLSGNGQYLFRNLPPGSYAVRFGNLPGGYAAAPLRTGGGANDGSDSDASAATGMQTRFVTLAEPPPTGANINRNLDLGLVPNLTDVAVSISGPSEAIVGQYIDYTVTAQNVSAGAPAVSVLLTHNLPFGSVFVSGSGSPTVFGTRLTWGLGTLAPGASRTFSVRARAPSSMNPPAPPQNLVSQVSVTTTSQEVTTANNSAAVTTRLVRPEIRVLKGAPPAVLVGDELSYTLSYENLGSTVASSVVINDTLASGLTFTGFITNPGGVCAYLAASRTVQCPIGSLAPGAAGTVAFAARAEPTLPGASVANTAMISTGTPGDSPSGNSSTASTAVRRPNLAVAVTIAPAPFPVGASGAIDLSYQNRGDGEARAATLDLELAPGDYALGALPGGCGAQGAPYRLRCSLGTLAPGASGALRLPIALPADFPGDRLTAAATITSPTPERPADLADNSAAAAVDVVRPNVFVDAHGPDSIVGRGSVFWYTIDYGNLLRRSPALTRIAENVVLRATLPAEVAFVEADAAPTATDGRTLTWELGALAAQATGRIIVVVRTDVAAGATLRLDATIATSTPGDDPVDNADSVTTDVAQPPASIPATAGDIRLAIRSELDPNSQDGDPANGVYVTAGSTFAWPTGEVLDFTPRLRELAIPDEAALPFPYEYRARVIGWSLKEVEVNDAPHAAAAADSRGRAGCRPGAATAAAPRLLEGCAYGYIGGESLAAIRAPAQLHEAQLRDQAHIYWTQPPAPPMRDDVYLYAVAPLAPARLAVQLEVEVWIVNAYPGEIGGIPLPEIPVAPLPDPERQLIAESFNVTLLAPRSLVGPGSR